jgi:hypothetical protein
MPAPHIQSSNQHEQWKHMHLCHDNLQLNALPGPAACVCDKAAVAASVCCCMHLQVACLLLHGTSAHAQTLLHATAMHSTNSILRQGVGKYVPAFNCNSQYALSLNHPHVHNHKARAESRQIALMHMSAVLSQSAVGAYAVRRNHEEPGHHCMPASFQKTHIRCRIAAPQ